MKIQHLLFNTTLPLESFPELPPMPLPNAITSFSFCALVSTTYPPVIDRDTDSNEGDDHNCLQWFREYSSAEQEQAHAAEDYWRCDPSSVRPFQIRLPDSQHDESKN